MLKVADIRQHFIDELASENFVIDKSGVKTIEMIGATFEADEPMIFGTPNQDYIDRELDWYKSKSLYVKDIPGKTPAIWEAVADSDGKINSNYGYLIWSDENYEQYWKVLNELRANPNSRRAVMIYTRPSIWEEYNKNGMSDFICTNAVQYMIRDDTLIAVVQMRSNDSWAGYRNDWSWQDHVVKLLAAALGIDNTKIIWHVGNLHLYQKQFYLADHYAKTNEPVISLKDYKEKYPESKWI